MIIMRALPALLALLLSAPSALGDDTDFHAIYTPLQTFRVAEGYEIELAVDLTNFTASAATVSVTFLGTEELESQWYLPMGEARLAPQETRRFVQLVRVPEDELRLWQEEDRLPRLRVAYRGNGNTGATIIDLVPPAPTEVTP